MKPNKNYETDTYWRVVKRRTGMAAVWGIVLAFFAANWFFVWWYLG